MIKFTVCANRYTMRLQGDRVEDTTSGGKCEYGTHDTLQEAIDEVRDLAADPDNVTASRTRSGVGSIDHMVYTVDAYAYDADADEWTPCNPDGTEAESCGTEPAYTYDALDQRQDLADAFNKAVKAYHGFLDYDRETFGSLFDCLPEED